MWRIIYERAPKGGLYYGTGPWHPSKEEAEFWLGFLARFYPEARLQSWHEAYPDTASLQ